MIYDPNIQMPPKEVCDAAMLVANYFKGEGVERWEFMDLCSRNHAAEIRAAKETLFPPVDLTHRLRLQVT